MKTCVIIDDEPKAIDLLKLYCDRLSEITVAASFRDPVEALQYLNTNQVDIIFLDINMPKVNGLTLAKILGEDTPIVFTTAYAEHAVESYELGAHDYLLKPISFERFITCINRVKETIIPSKSIVSIKSGTKTFRVTPSEILYLEKDGNYCYYHLRDKKIMARESIKEALEKLPHTFIQIHKSFIVNLNKVESFGADYLMINDIELTISDSFKKKAIDLLQG